MRERNRKTNNNSIFFLYSNLRNATRLLIAAMFIVFKFVRFVFGARMEIYLKYRSLKVDRKSRSRDILH